MAKFSDHRQFGINNDVVTETDTPGEGPRFADTPEDSDGLAFTTPPVRVSKPPVAPAPRRSLDPTRRNR